MRQASQRATRLFTIAVERLVSTICAFGLSVTHKTQEHTRAVTTGIDRHASYLLPISSQFRAPEAFLASGRRCEELQPYLWIRTLEVEGTDLVASLIEMNRSHFALSGKTPPVTDAEAHVASLSEPGGSYAFIKAYLAAANDDASPLPVSSYQRYDEYFQTGAIFWDGAASTTPRKCANGAASPPRLDQWFKLHQTSSLMSSEVWPCDRFSIFYQLHFDGGPRCSPHRIAVDEGTARCRVTMEAYASCPVMQLEGSALESCRHDLNCKDCVPGWCWTEVPELVGRCSTGFQSYRFRFVYGADHAEVGGMQITCFTETPPSGGAAGALGGVAPR